jgi:hypothetical protein
MSAVASFRTASDAAAVASRMLASGESLSRVWRTTGDARVDAAFAAMAEHLGRRDGWQVPAWTREPQREALPWWFVTELRGLHPRALVESPSSFRRRGVFITRGALERV